MTKKRVIAGSKGKFMGKYKGFKTWHRISAKSTLEAKAKMLKGTKFNYQDITIKKFQK